MSTTVTRRGAWKLVAVNRAPISVDLICDLDGIKGLRIEHAGRTVVLSPADLLEALQPPAQEPTQ